MNLVRDTGRALERILVQVADVNRVVGEIAAGAKEQTTGLQEVNTAVNRMDQVTQQNAAMVEETAAASLNLRHEADNLVKLVGRFQVGQQMSAPQAVAAKPAAARPAVATKPAATRPLPPKAPAAGPMQKPMARPAPMQKPMPPAGKAVPLAGRSVPRPASAPMPSRTAAATARKPAAQAAEDDWEEF